MAAMYFVSWLKIFGKFFFQITPLIRKAETTMLSELTNFKNVLFFPIKPSDPLILRLLNHLAFSRGLNCLRKMDELHLSLFLGFTWIGRTDEKFLYQLWQNLCSSCWHLSYLHSLLLSPFFWSLSKFKKFRFLFQSIIKKTSDKIFFFVSSTSNLNLLFLWFFVFRFLHEFRSQIFFTVPH